MKAVKSILEVVGFVVLFMALLGAFDIGHFRLYYGPDDIVCKKV